MDQLPSVVIFVAKYSIMPKVSAIVFDSQWAYLFTLLHCHRHILIIRVIHACTWTEHTSY